MLISRPKVSEAARQLADNILELPDTSGQPASGRPCDKVKSRADIRPQEIESSSSYVLANENYSQLSHDVDRWINGSRNSTGSTGLPLQNNGIPTIQRPVNVRTSTMDRTGLWYMIALLLPLFGFDSTQWRCNTNLLINGSQLLVAQIRQACRQARVQMRNLAQDRVARELFATAMDIVLVIYAIGFLILSMYQASIFG